MEACAVSQITSIRAISYSAPRSTDSHSSSVCDDSHRVPSMPSTARLAGCDSDEADVAPPTPTRMKPEGIGIASGAREGEEADCTHQPGVLHHFYGRRSDGSA